jgi:hypothetical protein
VIATPKVVDRVDLDRVSAVLIERMPRTPAGQLDCIGRGRARRRGEACGRLARLGHPGEWGRGPRAAAAAVGRPRRCRCRWRCTSPRRSSVTSGVDSRRRRAIPADNRERCSSSFRLGFTES